MKKILVYMASYNGEEYLREQLDSIINQKNVEVSILIGDDKSSDNTLNILEEYSKKYSNIKYLQNQNNLGYRLNFINLLSQNLDKQYDYFALSDQDDVWLDNKLEKAIELLEKEDKSLPLLYSSNLKAVDENLNYIKMMFSKDDFKTNDYQRFLENTATGCTCVFNNKLRENVLKYPTSELKEPHDEIIEKIAIATGKYIFDSNAYILYRQHTNNQIGVNDKGKAKKHFDFLIGKKKMYHSYVSSIIYDIFEKDFISNEMRLFVYNVGKYKGKFKSKMKFIFSNKYKKSTFKKTILLKTAVLFRRY